MDDQPERFHDQQCKTPQFLMWLRSFLSLAVSGGLPIAKYDKFAEHGFRGRRWMWVDPMKDMNAAKMARDHGWKTDSQIAEDLGGDYDENQETAKRDREARQKNGNPEPQIGNGNMPQPKEKDDEDEIEETGAAGKA
jgi:capsid protein